MIVVRFKNGRDWEWATSDNIVVNGVQVQFANIAKIEMEGMILGGRDITVAGAAWRDFLMRDPETMVPFIVSMPIEKAQEVGMELSKHGPIILATQMPRLPE